MTKDKLLAVRVEESVLNRLERIAKKRGTSLPEMVRAYVDSQMVESDVDIDLEALYELRASIDRRIAQKEDEKLAKIKASQKPPDLVIVEIGPSVEMKVERSEAVKAGVKFRER